MLTLVSPTGGYVFGSFEKEELITYLERFRSYSGYKKF